MKVAFHIHEKNGDIHEFVPATAAFLKYRTHIFEHAVTLRFKVEALKLPMLIEFQAGNFIGLGIPRADS